MLVRFLGLDFIALWLDLSGFRVNVDRLRSDFVVNQGKKGAFISNELRHGMWRNLTHWCTALKKKKTSLKINHAARASKVDTLLKLMSPGRRYMQKRSYCTKQQVEHVGQCHQVQIQGQGPFFHQEFIRIYLWGLLQAWTKLNLPPSAKREAVGQFQQWGVRLQSLHILKLTKGESLVCYFFSYPGVPREHWTIFFIPTINKTHLFCLS